VPDVTTISQSTVVVAVHPQPDEVATFTTALPPLAGTVCAGGVTV
jgi:hypothetical protein